MLFVPAPHPPEFRRRAVELALGEASITALAKQLSISESCLRNPMAQADADDSGGTDSRLRAAEKTELAQLRRDQRRLEMENEILQRAAA